MNIRITLVAAVLPFVLYACGKDVVEDSGDEPGTSPSGGTNSGGAGGEGSALHDGELIDDFEDGDQTNAMGTNWYLYTDAGANGASVVSGPQGGEAWIVAEGFDSSHSLSVQFTRNKGTYAWEPFVGVGSPIPESVVVGGFEGISYAYRGAAHTLRFETSNIKDYDFYVFTVPPATDWTKITIPFASLAQAGYGAPLPWEPELLTNINWHIVGADGTSGTLELDDVWFEKTAPVERGPKNLVIHQSAPPTKTILASIAISNPLQAKAKAELDRGYNLTNWLESGRFSSFVYDETDVENLANAGFRSLRLPIDLDLYVTGSSGSGDAVTLTIDDDLWTILDSFDEWTTAHGLSLTIDYHQYDKSFAFSDSEGVDEAVALWRAVAAHFKANPRDDLYFELLNEPELSTGANGILPADSWTPVATRMIAAIRDEDPEHTIIFGDVNWYGIAQLAARTPFADDNIVYAFHFYEPFVFTHQGADWASQGTTHDVPFPYSEERWSEYSSDFGLTTAQPNWIWDQFRNYHVQGTSAAVWNRLAVAKAWAVEHQVPIVCNEFGVYDKRSRLEDRSAYYADLIGMFEELEIPWQHWFMIMDENGEVIPEYIEAFRLNQ